MITMNEYKKKWLDKQVALWKSLQGTNLKKIYGIREPLDWEDEDSEHPIYEHPSILFNHLAKCWLVLNDGRTFKLSTAQDDDIFGLFISDNELVDMSDERLTTLKWSGCIDSCEVMIEEDNISKVELNLDGLPRMVVAGEVEPEWEGYIIRNLDESVLLFDSKSDYLRTQFGKSINVNLKK